MLRCISEFEIGIFCIFKSLTFIDITFKPTSLAHYENLCGLKKDFRILGFAYLTLRAETEKGIE